MSDKTISAPGLSALAAALKAAKPVIEDAASLARAAAAIMASTGHFVKGTK